MKNITWLEGNRIQIDPPKKTKKITGTRFASVLGLNPWSTPFEVWCDVTRLYKKPIEDEKYINAGKAIEPKQAEFIQNSYGFEITSPADIFGEDYYGKTFGDFYPAEKVFGGMWDYLITSDDGSVEYVLEMKTTKRVEDWENDVPEYYAMQAALYAYLLGVDKVIMVMSILTDADYDKPENYVPSMKNTITHEFSVAERYPDFADKLDAVAQWWAEYVETGISPEYDERADADILKALRTTSLAPDSDINEFIAEAEELKAEVDAVSASIADKEKRLKELTDIIKDYAVKNFRDGDKKTEIAGDKYKWTVSKSDTVTVDKDALTADGLIDKYTKTSTSYRITCKGVV